MVLLTKTFTSSWLNLDSWSETYIGIYRIVYKILPSDTKQQTSEDGALCQLAVVGANHLMEVALFSLFKPYINAKGFSWSITQKEFENAGYYDALSKWVPQVLEKPLDLSQEPFFSTERLRKRRNVTIHKTSAVATIDMAHSALYSAVEGSKALYSHFGELFKYKKLIEQYPLPIEKWFSATNCP